MWIEAQLSCAECCSAAKCYACATNLLCMSPVLQELKKEQEKGDADSPEGSLMTERKRRKLARETTSARNQAASGADKPRRQRKLSWA